MGGKNPKAVRKEITLTDDQMITERKLPRRSFLTAAGTILAGGAAALVAGRRISAQNTTPAKQADPDAKPAADPKKMKTADPDKKKKHHFLKKSKKSTGTADPNKAKTADPDTSKP